MFINILKRASFKFEIIPGLFFLGFIALFLALGAWQLRRAQEKQNLLDQQHKNVATESIQLTQATTDDAEALRYKPVVVHGHYDSAHQFLIDNQHNAGKAGYFVLTPFILDGGNKAVMVNRGWVPLMQNRTVLPDIALKNANTLITGRINKFPGVGIKLEGAEIPTKAWPSLVQVVESPVLAETLAYPLFSFQIELDNNQPDGYAREWHEAALMLPWQHKAYAFQWFALALTVTIIFIAYSFKKNDH